MKTHPLADMAVRYRRKRPRKTAKSTFNAESTVQTALRRPLKTKQIQLPIIELKQHPAQNSGDTDYQDYLMHSTKFPITSKAPELFTVPLAELSIRAAPFG